MIFVTVGTQLGFDRLLIGIDIWASKHKDVKIFAQIGNGFYKPNNFEYVQWLSPEDYDRMIRETKVLVSHAGMGTIITAINCSLPAIMLPRLCLLGEHRNDHQLATSQKFSNRQGLYFINNDFELHKLLDKWFELDPPLEDSYEPIELINTLRDFINT